MIDSRWLFVIPLAVFVGWIGGGLSMSICSSKPEPIATEPAPNIPNPANSTDLWKIAEWCDESPAVKEYVRGEIAKKGGLAKSDWFACYDILHADPLGKERRERVERLAALKEAVK